MKSLLLPFIMTVQIRAHLAHSYKIFTETFVKIELHNFKELSEAILLTLCDRENPLDDHFVKYHAVP